MIALILQAALGITAHHPDVMVVILDDLANDRLAVYGESLLAPAEMPVTPAIDAVAAAGLRCTGFYTSHTCSPSRAALMTGLYPAHDCVGDPYGPGDLHSDYTPTLGQWFQDAGYATSYVGKWHINATEDTVVDPAAPNLRGWRDFAGHKGNAGDYFAWKLTVNGTTSDVVGYRPQVFLDFAVSAWTTMRSPKIEVVALSLPHRPLHDPPQSWVTHAVGGTELQQWVTMIEAADFVLGQLRALLQPNDYLFVLADNGDIRPATTFSDWPEAKGTMKEPGINVPLLIQGPGIAAGTVSGALLGAYDVAPTLADLCHVPTPAVDGHSFTDVLRARPVRDREFVWSSWYRPNGDWTLAPDQQWALVAADGWKLIRTIDSTGTVDELYDLNTAPPGWDGTPVVNNVAQLHRLQAELDARIGGL